MDFILLTGIFFATNVLHTLTNLYVTWLYKRKVTYAIVFFKNGNNKILKIRTSKETFSHDKETYLIPVNAKEYFTKIGSKQYIRYVEGNPSPFKWDNDVKPDIQADVFYSVIQNSGLKLLNSPPITSEMIKYILIGGVVLVVLYFIFGGSAAPPATP